MPIEIPIDIIEHYDNWTSIQHLSSIEINKVLIETIGFYSFRFTKLIQEIDSYEYFDNFLTFYEYYSQIRLNIKNINSTTTQRIRFIRSVLEEAVRLKLTTSKKSKRKDYKIIGELYRCFINMSVISNKLSINTILDIQTANLERNKSNTILLDSNVYSLHLNVAYGFIKQCSKERYLNNDYTNQFFNVLSEIGLQEKDFYAKLSDLFKHVYSNNRMPLHEFKEFLRDQGNIFCHLMLGLLLEEEHLSQISDRIRRPYETKRHLTNPFLVWEIDNKKYVMIENRAFIDSFEYTVGDLLCFGKAPSQWEQIFSKSLIDSFNQGKDFENKIEEFLLENKIPYLREIKIYYNDKYIEPDFVIYIQDQNLLILVECKNLMKKNDPNSWLNDYWRFCSSKNKLSFNDKMYKLLAIVDSDISQISERFNERFKLRFQKPQLKGLFLVNSPTLYMFASEHLIVTWKMFTDMIKQNIFTGEMIFQNEDYYIEQNIRFFRYNQFPSQLIHKKTGGGIMISNN